MGVDGDDHHDGQVDDIDELTLPHQARKNQSGSRAFHQSEADANAIIAVPDASRRRQINAGRAAAPSRMPLAAKATTMSAKVLSATDTKPSTTKLSATLPRVRSTIGILRLGD
jgi:hypothetical protein